MLITGTPTPLIVPADPPRETATTTPGWPCRRCLRDGEPGDAMLLVPYDPWLLDSPYRQTGPVWVHERACQTHQASRLPQQQRGRLLSLRGFDAAGLPSVAEVVPGEQAEQRLREVLADGTTEFVHLHNAGPGCFAARVDR